MRKRFSTKLLLKKDDIDSEKNERRENTPVIVAYLDKNTTNRRTISNRRSMANGERVNEMSPRIKKQRSSENTPKK